MRAVAVSAVALVAVLGYPATAQADEVRDAQWHLDALAVGAAHAYSRGDGVTVAVIDSGVDASHPDLRGNVLPGTDLVGGSDGRDDPGGSGTALAGLIAGHGQPGGAGVLGLAPEAAVLPVAVAAPGASPRADVLAAGIDEAVRLGAGVLCLGRPLPDDPAVNRALGAALAGGALVVVPGGTGGDALARFQGAGLLGAAPLDASPPAGVAVPADGVLTTGGQGGYYRYARTAEAAAAGVLAGAAALVRSAYPDLAGYQAVHRIEATAAGGELRLVDALTAAVGPAPEPPPPAAAPSPAPVPVPPPAEPAPGLEPGPAPVTTRVAAFDAEDWRRRLVAVPLVVFLGVAVAVSVAAARRSRR